MHASASPFNKQAKEDWSGSGGLGPRDDLIGGREMLGDIGAALDLALNGD